MNERRREHAIDHESLWLFSDAGGEAAEAPIVVRRKHVDPNLSAARRLSQRIGTLADHSPEQVRAGQQICRHLLAMLQARSADARSGGNRSH